MDTLDIGYRIQRHVPIIRDVIGLLPTWVWVILAWAFATFLFKPYISAVVRLYQPKIDLAARKTPSVLKRVAIEVFRLGVIGTQLPSSIMFILTPKKRRLRVWRKNYIVFFIWLFSSHFPRGSYYRRVRSWFETNVYLDKRTSYILPEPLKVDGPYIQQKLEEDLNVSHGDFVQEFLDKNRTPIVRVGAALTRMKPANWMGKRKTAFGWLYAWVYNILFIASVYYLFTENMNGVITFVLGVILFRIDRVVLTRRILKKAKIDPEFYNQAIKLRVIQLHW